MKNTFNKNSGFTLIEIIVSLGIFTIVAVVATGAFLKVIDANKKSQSLKTAINNVNFALESISRELRVGSNYYCFNNLNDLNAVSNMTSDTFPRGYASCNAGGVNGVAFLSSKTASKSNGGTCNLIHAFFFNTTGPTMIEKAEEQECGGPLGSFSPIISPEVIITDYNMNIFPALSSDGPQPRAFIHIKGYAGSQEKNKTYFDVQTTVSQRNTF